MVINIDDSQIQLNLFSQSMRNVARSNLAGQTAESDSREINRLKQQLKHSQQQFRKKTLQQQVNRNQLIKITEQLFDKKDKLHKELRVVKDQLEQRNQELSEIRNRNNLENYKEKLAQTEERNKIELRLAEVQYELKERNEKYEEMERKFRQSINEQATLRAETDKIIHQQEEIKRLSLKIKQNEQVHQTVIMNIRQEYIEKINILQKQRTQNQYTQKESIDKISTLTSENINIRKYFEVIKKDYIKSLHTKEEENRTLKLENQNKIREMRYQLEQFKDSKRQQAAELKNAFLKTDAKINSEIIENQASTITKVPIIKKSEPMVLNENEQLLKNFAISRECERVALQQNQKLKTQLISKQSELELAIKERQSLKIDKNRSIEQLKVLRLNLAANTQKLMGSLTKSQGNNKILKINIENLTKRIQQLNNQQKDKGMLEKKIKQKQSIIIGLQENISQQQNNIGNFEEERNKIVIQLQEVKNKLILMSEEIEIKNTIIIKAEEQKNVQESRHEIQLKDKQAKIIELELLIATLSNKQQQELATIDSKLMLQRQLQLIKQENHKLKQEYRLKKEEQQQKIIIIEQNLNKQLEQNRLNNIRFQAKFITKENQFQKYKSEKQKEIQQARLILENVCVQLQEHRKQSKQLQERHEKLLQEKGRLQKTVSQQIALLEERQLLIRQTESKLKSLHEVQEIKERTLKVEFEIKQKQVLQHRIKYEEETKRLLVVSEQLKKQIQSKQYWMEMVKQSKKSKVAQLELQIGNLNAQIERINIDHHQQKDKAQKTHYQMVQLLEGEINLLKLDISTKSKLFEDQLMLKSSENIKYKSEAEFKINGLAKQIQGLSISLKEARQELEKSKQIEKIEKEALAVKMHENEQKLIEYQQLNLQFDEYKQSKINQLAEIAKTLQYTKKRYEQMQKLHSIEVEKRYELVQQNQKLLVNLEMKLQVILELKKVNENLKEAKNENIVISQEMNRLKGELQALKSQHENLQSQNIIFKTQNCSFIAAIQQKDNEKSNILARKLQLETEIVDHQKKKAQMEIIIANLTNKNEQFQEAIISKIKLQQKEKANDALKKLKQANETLKKQITHYDMRVKQLSEKIHIKQKEMTSLQQRVFILEQELELSGHKLENQKAINAKLIAQIKQEREEKSSIKQDLEDSTFKNKILTVELDGYISKNIPEIEDASIGISENDQEIIVSSELIQCPEQKIIIQQKPTISSLVLDKVQTIQDNLA